MLHLYCGDGKGKTTAAFGLALRMAGAGKKILIAQFFKNGSSSEVTAICEIPGVTVYTEEKHFGRVANMSQSRREEAEIYYPQYFESVLERAAECDGVVLDEAVSALRHGFLIRERLFGWLEENKEEQEIVLTGRNPDEELLELADYVTEMKKIRHPHDKGIMARKGVEF